MSYKRRKHMPTVANGRYLQPVELERLLHGQSLPDMQIRATKDREISAGALEARRLMEQAKAEYQRQKGGQA